MLEEEEEEEKEEEEEEEERETNSATESGSDRDCTRFTPSPPRHPHRQVSRPFGNHFSS